MEGNKVPRWDGVTTVTPSLHERAAYTLLLSFAGTRDVTVRTHARTCNISHTTQQFYPIACATCSVQNVIVRFNF